MKKGFSLGEMLVTMAIMGVILALTLPIVTNTVASNNKPLYRSAFMKTEEIVNELINDIALYPTGELTNTFCTNFFAKVNTIGTVDCATAAPTDQNGVTTNGMIWYNMNGAFVNGTCPDGATGDCVKLSVDIDGTKGLNTVGKDILYIYLSKTGRITVTAGSTEAGYLTN